MSKTFGAESTTDEVLKGCDLRGKRVLVTASAGLRAPAGRSLPLPRESPRPVPVAQGERGLCRTASRQTPTRQTPTRGPGVGKKSSISLFC
jgi:hypothetical protein